MDYGDLSLLYLPILYSEVHYCLKLLRPLYFKKEPEVVFDLPRHIYTSRANGQLPLFLLVKDAHKYPATIKNIVATICCNKQTSHYTLSPEITAKKPLQTFEFALNMQPSWVGQTIAIFIRFELGEGKHYRNDNYKSAHHNFYVDIVEEERAFPKGWLIGDVHYHSSYTADQVEFGAPLAMTKKIAYAMGLDWFFVTDHSYDLDDCEDDYLHNDPALPKWEAMRRECFDLTDDNVRVIAAEEVSIGNRHSQNVHLLVVNHPEYIAGAGDSAEKWLANKPDHHITDLNIDCLTIAAHPFETVPALQKWLLNRGNWAESDLRDGGVKYLQIINGKDLKENLTMLDRYFELLLTGERYIALAGNDAHGNFQYYKQITIPFVKLMCKRQQVFGEYFTAVKFAENDPVTGIFSDNIVVSNGPFLSFTITCDDCVYGIGQTILSPTSASLFFQVEYGLEKRFGLLQEMVLITGYLKEKRVSKKKIDLLHFTVEVACDTFFAVLLLTKKGYMAITNPIWIEM